MGRDGRTPILYVAPWVDYGGTDKGTIDWFRWLDRDRYAPSLVTTQPSSNRRLKEIAPFAEEVWPLSDLMSGPEMPQFIFDFIHTREVELLHVMNSRLGYELLPDLACLLKPPKVVVQLHVEEADRSGYVRYVTTRYGNLVHAFSVTSEHLAEVVRGYGISRDRIEVIYTGVDAEEEFSPDRVRPIEGLDPDRVHILFPGRLVEQKDPLLTVEVATGLRDKGLRFQIHAVGEGDLEGEVRRLIDERGLAQELLIHPATSELPRWFAACDVLLMTSVYEGVPYVVFEAMAMGVPVVAPALPGNVELLGELSDGLVEPRDDVAGYVTRLAGLIEDRGRRLELGALGRERVRERFSLQRMGQEHGRLYDRVLGPRRGTSNGGARAPLAPIRFRNRRLYDTPLVSVIVPCFNHGRFLGECVDAVRNQTYPSVETIVVDDASTDRETVAVIDELSRADDVTVLRLPENGGPSRARNAGLERCTGRYVLPVDADNVLLPDAIERLVEQIKVAGEEVGFIYPNLQYFGNREDYFEAPDWDLYALMQRNVCDVCSLFDREVFDAGERFDESIRLGHEDWEFILRLGARGVQGEPAREPTLLYRKVGFNRSDSVEYAADAFHHEMRRLSPLYEREREPAVKARWAPAASLIALEPVDASGEAGRRLAERLDGQSCTDVELIARFDCDWPIRDSDVPVRRISPALAPSAGAALADAIGVARGRVRIVTRGPAPRCCVIPASWRRCSAYWSRPGSRQIRWMPWRSRARARTRRSRCSWSARRWRRDAPTRWCSRLRARTGCPSRWRSTSRILSTPCCGSASMPGSGCSGGMSPSPSASPRPPKAAQPCGCRAGGRGSGAGARRAKGWRKWRACIPSMPGMVPRWVHASTWTPPQSLILSRHREHGGERRLVTTSRTPPRGFELEYDLGCVRVFSLEGTERLVSLDDGGYATLPLGDWAAAPAESHLGYVEAVAFVGLEPLILADHPRTGQRVLVSGSRDPLMHEIEPLETLGFVEAFPANPQHAPHADSTYGLVGLTRALDTGARRHRAAIGELAPGDPIGELGGLIADGSPPSVPAWIVDGTLVTDRHHPPSRRVTPTAAGRWVLAPLAWRGFSSRAPKLRAMARRGLASPRALGRHRPSPVTEPDGPPQGWLLADGVAGTWPLYAAYHPVTGDQLLSTNRFEPIAMSYGEPELLGHIWPAAPVTGSLEQRPVPVPWASRFGLQAPRR